MGQTTAFFIDEVELILDTEKFGTLKEIKDFLYKNDRAFIWDNMIKSDREIKQVLKDTIKENRIVNIRARLNPKYSAAKEGKKKILRYRSKKTGRYISKNTKNLFI